MSIGKINCSLAGGLTQETTLALANLNFDFALYKVEAPAEYQGLGACLSKQRRAAAESGNEHILARKLGALFSQVLPATPKLVRAYGKRATEIINEASNRDTSCPRRENVFGEWSGADATSIWAAATSGAGAIAAHLLACMLARMWTASEAEAVWEEIISIRKQEIGNSEPGNAMWQSQELAAKIEVTKDQISRWDSSARSWLQIADKSRMKQQKQLELLVEDASIPVNQASTTYRSVMDAWTTALSTVETLLEGVSQSINDGAVILALTAWHIFPDMFVLGAGQKVIAQHDPLYPEGTVITLGQSSRPPDAASRGIFWSLPLAFLRYYGDPVVLTRTLGERTSRLTFPEVMQVVLGCVLAGWGDYAGDVEQACANIVSLAELILPRSLQHYERTRSWIQLLADAAESHLAETGSTKSHLRGLTLRGLRRYKHLLWGPEEKAPGLFGLLDLNTVLQLIGDMERKVSFLRLVASGLSDINSHDLLIRYRVPRSRAVGFFGHFNNPDYVEEPEGFGLSWLGEEWTWEYATALEQHPQPLVKKRKYTMSPTLAGHIRWTARDNHVGGRGEEYVKITALALETTSQSFRWRQQDSTELCSHPDADWNVAVGNPEEAAIFRRSCARIPGFEDARIAGATELKQECVEKVLQSDWLDPKRLIDLMDHQGWFGHHNPPHYLECLRALAAAAEAYKLMPGATISTDLFSAPLKDALWIPKHSTGHSSNTADQGQEKTPQDINFTSLGLQRTSRLSQCPATPTTPRDPNCNHNGYMLRSYTLSRNQVFSCIAMFENRKVNLDPHILDQVMAISASGSIYVAMPLICDPFDLVQPNEIKHITGNISKPGLSLMIPPVTPKLRKVDEDKWRLVNHAAFDGQLDNSFQHTSLHLSFTGYQLPMLTAEHGYQGIEANFVETLVSVFDGHDWVADLDILKALAMPSISRVGQHILTCSHNKGGITPDFTLTSIDSWDEFIDRPSNACIFRASGNWLARLSAAAINAQQSLDTIVLEDGKRICWKCVENKGNIKGENTQRRLLLIG